MSISTEQGESVRKKHKRSNTQLRSRAKAIVTAWYEKRVDERRNRFAAVNGKPVLPAQEYNKVDRAPRVPRTKRRPSGLVDPKTGKPVMETVAIMDTLTADGVDTTRRTSRRFGGGNFPGGPGMSPEFSGKSGYYYHDEYLEFAEKLMLHVLNCSMEWHKALEMNAAGYDVEYIATEIGCGRDIARSYVNEGLAVVCSCLIIKPWSLERFLEDNYDDDEDLLPPLMVAEDIGLGRP